MARKKSQTSVEFIITAALLFSVILVIAAANLDVLASGNERMRITKVKHAIDELSKQAELVYQEGYGAKTKVYINIPNSISATSVNDGIITINLTTMGGEESFFRKLDFNATGTIPSEEGSYWVEVESLGTYVEISNINTTG